MFLALMPQFVSATASYPMWLQLALLGVSYTLATFAVYTGVALTAKTVLVGRPAAAKAVTRVSGATMIALAVALVVEQVFVG